MPFHAFRDGNGRAQLAFVIMLADRAGHPVNLENLRPVKFLKAVVASFFGNEKLLASELSKLI